MGRSRGGWVVVVALLVAAACTGDDAARPDETTTPAAKGSVLVYRERVGAGDDLSFTLQLENPIGSAPYELLVPGEGMVADPVVSPDGTSIAFVTYEGDDAVGPIWISSVEQRSAPPRMVSPLGQRWWCPRWMPDGRLMGFLDDTTDHLAFLDLATGEVSVTSTRFPVEELGFCADPNPAGDEIAVSRQTDSGSHEQREVWALPIGRGAPPAHLLGTLPEGCIVNDADWSPDGNRVAVDAICERAEESGIWLVGTDGEDPTQLVGENGPDTSKEDAYQYWSPVWDPTGDAVVYYRVDTIRLGEVSHPSIWTVDVANGRARELVEAPTADPAVGPSPG